MSFNINQPKQTSDRRLPRVDYCVSFTNELNLSGDGIFVEAASVHKYAFLQRLL